MNRSARAVCTGSPSPQMLRLAVSSQRDGSGYERRLHGGDSGEGHGVLVCGVWLRKAVVALRETHDSSISPQSRPQQAPR